MQNYPNLVTLNCTFNLGACCTYVPIYVDASALPTNHALKSYSTSGSESDLIIEI
jgi:hypothetical protein